MVPFTWNDPLFAREMYKFHGQDRICELCPDKPHSITVTMERTVISPTYSQTKGCGAAKNTPGGEKKASVSGECISALRNASLIC